jgi:hypothetical protein
MSSTLLFTNTSFWLSIYLFVDSNGIGLKLPIILFGTGLSF